MPVGDVLDLFSLSSISESKYYPLQNRQFSCAILRHSCSDPMWIAGLKCSIIPILRVYQVWRSLLDGSLKFRSFKVDALVIGNSHNNVSNRKQENSLIVDHMTVSHLLCSCLVMFVLLSQILFCLSLSWMFLLRFRVYISSYILVVLTMFQYLFPSAVFLLF